MKNRNIQVLSNSFISDIELLSLLQYSLEKLNKLVQNGEPVSNKEHKIMEEGIEQCKNVLKKELSKIFSNRSNSQGGGGSTPDLSCLRILFKFVPTINSIQNSFNRTTINEFEFMSSSLQVFLSLPFPSPPLLLLFLFPLPLPLPFASPPPPSPSLSFPFPSPPLPPLFSLLPPFASLSFPLPPPPSLFALPPSLSSFPSPPSSTLFPSSLLFLLFPSSPFPFKYSSLSPFSLLSPQRVFLVFPLASFPFALRFLLGCF